MKIKKIKDTYTDYQCELSFGQLVAIKNALATDHADPVSDELFAELDWYLGNIPGPGESDEDLKKEDEAAQSGLASPEAGQQPLQARADELLPEPEGGAPGGEEGGELEGPPMGGEGGEGGEFEGPPPEEGAGEEVMAGGGGEPVDDRLPPPPEE